MRHCSLSLSLSPSIISGGLLGVVNPHVNQQGISPSLGVNENRADKPYFHPYLAVMKQALFPTRMELEGLDKTEELKEIQIFAT